MKLKSLYIEDYKNIKQQTFDFSSNTGYIALIGENGSGKSNLLEAISLIFNELFGISNPMRGIGKFWIEYELAGNTYLYGNIDKDKEEIPLEKSPKLPSALISCYSGEDMRLWNLAYQTYYMSFFKGAAKGNEYVPKTLYVSKYCWKIALVALLFSLDNEIVAFVKDKLHIDITKTTIQFSYSKDNYDSHDAAKWLNSVRAKYGENVISISDLRDEGLNNSKYTDLTDDKVIFYYLYFLSMPKKNEYKGQTINKMIDDIKIKIDNIDFDDLSEGEKKLILIECITKVLGDENSLILLDEPDAHTHIARKKELLNAIESFEGQTIMTTHSPVFVEIMQKKSPSNVFYIENGQINPDKNNLIKKLSAEELNMLDGSLYAKSGMYLLVEGKSDVKCIKEAMKRFNYKKLEDVAIISFNGTSNALEFYNQAFKDSLSCINKLIFLFDYDEAGYKAWENVGPVVLSPDSKGKCGRLFYQKDYSSLYNTKPKQDKSDEILMEDLFNEDSYQLVTNVVHLNKCKDFRNINWKQQLNTSKSGIKSTVDAIKYYIEDKCDTFTDDSWFDGFKPLLDKLLELFAL